MKYCYSYPVPGFVAEELFDIVIDVERYPGFVPGWQAVRVHDRRDNSYRTEQIVRLKPISQRFQSLTTFIRPFSIDVTGQGDLFKRFDLSWRFAPAGDGCLVSLQVGIGIAFRPLRLAIDAAAREMARVLVEAFIVEARRRDSHRRGQAETEGIARNAVG